MNKNSFFITVVFLLLTALLLNTGCEKGTNTWGYLKNQPSEDLLRSFSGRVVLKDDGQSSISFRGNLQLSPAVEAEVWLEEKPEIRTKTDSNGNFLLTGVPDGTYHIVCRFGGLAGLVFKTRTAEASISGTPVNMGDIQLAEARNFVSGRIFDMQGKPVSGAILSLWGETFQTGLDGRFTSPPIMQEIATATIQILSTGGFRSFAFPAVFKHEGKSEIEFSLASLYDNRFPPIVQINADATSIAPNSVIGIAAEIFDPDEIVAINRKIEWQSSHGLLSVASDRLTATWTAPDDNVTASISLTVTDSTGLVGKSSIQIISGSGGKGNEPPVISNFSVASAAESINLVFDISDAENDKTNLHLSYSIDNGTTFHRTENISGTSSDLMPGIAKTIKWRSGLDVKSLNPVILKLEISDRTGTGTPVISGSFNLDFSNIPPIQAPTALTLLFSSGKGILSWQQVSGASAYNVYWSETPGVTSSSNVFASVASPFEQSDLAHAKTYNYRVSAVNAWGESVLSNEVSGLTDFEAPALTTVFPENKTVGAASNSELIIDFSENVKAGEGSIRIYNNDNSIFSEIPAKSLMVSINQHIATIKVPKPFISASDYYVIIDTNAFSDESGNNFAGLSNSSSWTFRTAFEFNENLQWNHQIINASAAWLYATGRGIKVAVIDTGADDQHPDLAERISSGRDLVNDGTFLQDGLGHGTHVAGIIAARGNNAGAIGIAPNASLHIVKVFSLNGTGPTADMVVTAIQDSVNNGARIINMSIGTKIFNAAYEDAAAQARANGAIVIAAAGNDNSSQLRYLAACPSVLSVGATTANDQRWVLSNYSSELDFSAPGDQIFSTIPPSGYGSISGTSMASPHIAAVAALILEKNPTFSTEELVNALINSVEDIGDPGRDQFFGYGRIDALKAVTYKPSSASIRASSMPSKNSNRELKSDFSADKFVAGQLLLKLFSGSSLEKIIRECNLSASDIRVIKTIGSPDLLLLTVPKGQEKAIGKSLQNHPEVLYAELNAIMSFF